MKLNHIIAHMKAAYAYASASHAIRRKVGALLLKDNAPIACGWNGMPANRDNCCEGPDGKTLPDVIHAEVNTYLKLIKMNESSSDTTLVVTCLPCPSCAEFILNNTNTKEIYFSEVYRSVEGGKRLIENGVNLFHVDLDQNRVKLVSIGEGVDRDYLTVNGKILLKSA